MAVTPIFISAGRCGNPATFGFFVSRRIIVPPQSKSPNLGRTAAQLFLICTAASIALSFGYAEQRGDDVKVLKSDEGTFVFEYSPRYIPEKSIQDKNRVYAMYDFEGSQRAWDLEDIGSPDVRFKYFPLWFPSEKRNAVHVIAADYQDIPNVLLAPHPSYRVRDEFVETDKYEASPQKYQANSFVPGNPVEIDAPGKTRSLLIGGVKVFPIQYNPATRTLRKYSRLVVEVSYGRSAAPRLRNEDDALLRDVLLNHDVARNWKFSRATPRPAAITNSVLATGDWYRLTVSEEGMYKLDKAYFASLGINVNAIDPRTIKIYGNGGREIPEDLGAPRKDDLVENAIYVEGEADGNFGDADFVLFYGKSTRGWDYNSSARRLEHYINHYSDANYYWLTIGSGPGKRMQPQTTVSGTPNMIPDRFLDAVFVEDEKVNLLSSGKDWYGQALIPNGSFTYVNALPGLVQSDQVLYRYALVGRSNPGPTFTVREGNTLVGAHILLPVFFGGFAYADRAVFLRLGVFSYSNNTSQLTFHFSSDGAGATGWIDWLEIQYSRLFDAVNNYLRFRSPDTTGIVEYRLNQFSTNPMIFNLTVPEDVRLIVSGGTIFRDSTTAGKMNEYCAAGPGSFKTPAAVNRTQNQNIRGYAAQADSGADFIIVTSKEFRSVADRLKQFREQLDHGNLRTYIADVDLIYNEFGGGIPDITAIRDFLKYTYDNWPRRPEYVLMMGGASFDYRSFLGSRSSYVPTWQSPQSLNDITSYATDDFFVDFGGSGRPSMVTGRISARKLSEADLMVSKLIAYEQSSSRDAWNTRMVFVGDDGFNPENPGGEFDLHSSQTEALANAYTPDEFEKVKIYIADYPTAQTAQGRRKPGAYQAIIDEINAGALVVNYTGHGNPTVWAHENVFNVQTSIPQLVNADKLSVFFAATCNFSQFDDPKRYTGSELLLYKPDGGAIGAVSASRKVFSGDNAALHQNIFFRMFTRDSFGRLVVERPAKAIFLVKSTFGNSENDRKYLYLGDPTMRLRFPAGYASIDSINQQPLVGNPLPVQLQALSRVTVKGTIRDQNNVPDAFNGKATLIVNDATRRVTIVDFSPNFDWSYLAAGGIIYRGENSVVNGRFSAQFIVPKDIAYADSTTRARLVAYFSNAAADGLAFTKNIRVGGTDNSAPLDETGPSVKIFLDSRGFRQGDLVREKPVLYVDITDSSGINTSVTGIGHRIEAWLNNSPQSIDLTQYYTSRLDNYREGTVQYQLRDLTLGRNFIRIRAWDTYNNSSTAETYFEVSSSDQLRISDVLNYPNPFSGGTTFTFRQNTLAPLSINVKIYTLAGRLIHTLESASSGEPFLRIPWDGRDRDGDVLANGVYLYKVIVKTTDGRYSSEALGKLSVLK